MSQLLSPIFTIFQASLLQVGQNIDPIRHKKWRNTSWANEVLLMSQFNLIQTGERKKMKNPINVRSVVLGAAVLLTMNSATYSQAQEPEKSQTNVADYMNTNRLVQMAVTSLNSRGEGQKAMGEAGGIKSIEIDDTPGQPYVVYITTKNGCVITTTFKQGPVETKDLQAFAISQKSVECEK
jgi:hypothetical protein